MSSISSISDESLIKTFNTSVIRDAIEKNISDKVRCYVYLNTVNTVSNEVGVYTDLEKFEITRTNSKFHQFFNKYNPEDSVPLVVVTEDETTLGIVGLPWKNMVFAPLPQGVPL